MAWSRSSARANRALLALERALQGLDAAARHGVGLFGGALAGQVGERCLVGGDVTGQRVLGATNLLGLWSQGVVVVRGGLELGGQARRLGFERRHHVGVCRRLEGAPDGATPLGHHPEQTPAALREPLDPGEGHDEVLFALGGELGGGGLGGGVELGDGGDEGGLAVRQDSRARRSPPASRVEGGELPTDEVQPQRPQLLGQRGVGAGRSGLALEGPDLAAHLAQQVAEAVEVLLGGGQTALGTLAAAPVLQDAGRLLDDGATVLGTRVEDGPQLALAHDHVLLAPHPRVRQHLLDVEQPARLAVDGVLALTRSGTASG